jgi:hypothetical protein
LEELPLEERNKDAMTKARLIQIIEQTVSESDKVEEFKRAFEEALKPREIKLDFRSKMERLLEALVKEGRIDEEVLKFILEGLPSYSDNVQFELLDKVFLSLAIGGQFNLIEKGDIYLNEEGKAESFDLVARTLLDRFADESFAPGSGLRDLLFKSILLLYGHDRERLLRHVYQIRLTNRQKRLLFYNFEVFDRQKK